MIFFLVCFSAGSSFLLSFLLFFHPAHNNVKGNQLLGLFVFTLGLAFVDIYLRNTGQSRQGCSISTLVNTLRFTSAPLVYLSIRFFINPMRIFQPNDLLHFIPFVGFFIFRLFSNYSLDAYFLPLQMTFYVVGSYHDLVRHRNNLKLISSTIEETDLSWLRNFLLILLIDVLLWLNEIYFNFGFLIRIDPFIYSGSIYFLAYFSIRQTAVFQFQKQELTEIKTVFEEQHRKTRPRRLTDEQLNLLNLKLDLLMSQEKIYLENELNLPQVAEKLGIGIHDTSFLINEVTGENFYNFINRYRVEEAKRLLNAGNLASLNMLGIAFAAGFNSKTTFNTTFKKITGVSPTEYAKKNVRPYPNEQR